MMLVLYPLMVAGYVIGSALVVLSVVVFYISLVVLAFVGTALAMMTRAVFRSGWPPNPARPSRPRRPIPQARWSDRR